MGNEDVKISPDELRNLARILREVGVEAGKPLWNPAPGENELRDAFGTGWVRCCEAMERIADAEQSRAGEGSR